MTTPLSVIGRRMIIAGCVIAPPDAILIVLFWRWSNDFIGTFSLTMFLGGLTAILVGFGYAAISSEAHADDGARIDRLRRGEEITPGENER